MAFFEDMAAIYIYIYALQFKNMRRDFQEQYLNSRYQREKKPPPQQLALSHILSGEVVVS